MRQPSRFVLLGMLIFLGVPVASQAQVEKIAPRYYSVIEGPVYKGSGASREKVWYKVTYRVDRTRNKTTKVVKESPPVVSGKLIDRTEAAPERPDWAKPFFVDDKEPKETYDDGGKRYGIFNRTWYDYRIEGGKWTRYVRKTEDVRRLLGDAPENPPPPPPKPEKFQTRKKLTIKNDTGEKIVVYLLYRTVREGGKWEWLPGGPTETEKALRYEIDAGDETELLDDDEKPITASRIRIWAENEKAEKVWDDFKTKDHWLVEDDGTGERRYKADAMETYLYKFEK